MFELILDFWIPYYLALNLIVLMHIVSILIVEVFRNIRYFDEL